VTASPINLLLKRKMNIHELRIRVLTFVRAKIELERLNKNKERRLAREKQKGIYNGSVDRDLQAASPSATPAPSVEKPTGTTRKCANCGQAGHIKTNKKYTCFDCQEKPKVIASLSELALRHAST
jgi:transcription initiation factor TFIID subunit 1, fungi type